VHDHFAAVLDDRQPAPKDSRQDVVPSCWASGRGRELCGEASHGSRYCNHLDGARSSAREYRDWLGRRRAPLYKNCTNLNKKYPHGLGRAGARETRRPARLSPRSKRSTKLYKLAMSYNRGLDRDKDGIACEKA
jgi:hypothetical protein